MSPQKGNTMPQTPHGLQNPIQKALMFNTPKDWNEIHHYLEQLTGDEKTVATVVAGTVWNLAHKLVEDMIETENELFNKYNFDE